MMIEGALVWLTFFSTRYSSNQIEVVQKGFHEVFFLDRKFIIRRSTTVRGRSHQVSSCIKCCSGCQFHVNQWILHGMMLMTIVFEKQDVWSITTLRDPWKHPLSTDFSAARSWTSPNPTKSCPSQYRRWRQRLFAWSTTCHVSAILLLRLNAVQSLNAVNITIRDSWALLSRRRDNTLD